MTPNLLDELEKIVALSEKATPGPWRTDNHGGDDEMQVVGRPSWGCKRFGKKGEWTVAGMDDMVGEHPSEVRANAKLIAACVNFLRTHAPALADMAKQMEAAERDAARFAPCLWVQDADDGSWDTACGNKHLFIAGDAADNLYQHCPYCGGHLIEPNYDAIDATQEGAG